VSTETEQEPKAYENTTGITIGAVRILPGQPPKGIPVKAGEIVWLNADERKATANAPRSNDNNPFANGAFRRVREERAADATRPTDEVEHPVVREEAGSTVVDEDAEADNREERPPGTEPEAAAPEAPAAPPAEDVEATAAAKAEAAAAQAPASPPAAPAAPASPASTPPAAAKPPAAEKAPAEAAPAGKE
jgi:hypothetical protein